MYVEHSPEQLIDQTDGNPIKRITPSGSRYDTIEIKQTETTLVVKAHEGTTDNVQSWTFPLREKLLQVVGTDTRRRRDVDDDIQDALQLVSYTLSDTDAHVKRF